nr:MAG TPA: hypothetical protein [Caudoviricetes sp.]
MIDSYELYPSLRLSRPFFYLQLTLLIMFGLNKRWYSLFLISLTHSM